MPVLAASDSVALAFVELGAILLGLAILARISDRIGVSPIPAYLLAGLLFGEGGLAAPSLSADFLELAAEIGVVLLLLTLGLEYSPTSSPTACAADWRAGIVDLVLNATPGAASRHCARAGAPRPRCCSAGVTYISSSGVVAKVLGDLGRLGNRETPAVLTVLVIEDLAMAAYLPVVVGHARRRSRPPRDCSSVAVALAVVAGTVLVALRFGHTITRVLTRRYGRSVAARGPRHDLARRRRSHNTRRVGGRRRIPRGHRDLGPGRRRGASR